jgi:hypothetical protein
VSVAVPSRMRRSRPTSASTSSASPPGRVAHPPVRGASPAPSRKRHRQRDRRHPPPWQVQSCAAPNSLAAASICGTHRRQANLLGSGATRRACRWWRHRQGRAPRGSVGYDLERRERVHRRPAQRPTRPVPASIMVTVPPTSSAGRSRRPDLGTKVGVPLHDRPYQPDRLQTTRTELVPGREPPLFGSSRSSRWAGC